MYGKTWTTKRGEILELSKITETHLFYIAIWLQDKYDSYPCGGISLMSLYNIVEEIEDREKHNNLNQEWTGYTLAHIKDLFMKHNLTPPIVDDASIDLFLMNHKEKAKKINRSSKNLSKELEEKLWQETEQNMLPEGTLDRIEFVRYCYVNKITKRIDPFNSCGPMPALFEERPKLGQNCRGMKVRVILEILED